MAVLETDAAAQDASTLHGADLLRACGGRVVGVLLRRSFEGVTMGFRWGFEGIRWFSASSSTLGSRPPACALPRFSLPHSTFYPSYRHGCSQKVTPLWRRQSPLPPPRNRQFHLLPTQAQNSRMNQTKPAPRPDIRVRQCAVRWFLVSKLI
jgi:hypothetical protein